MQRVRLLAVAAVVASLVAGCGSSSKSTSSSGGKASAGHVTVAAFNFAESEILANMYADVLRHAGYSVTYKQLTNREIVEPALWAGQVDVVPEYVGTLTEFINTHDNGPNAKQKASSSLSATVAALRAEATRHHIAVLDPSQAADENAFAVQTSFAQAHHLSALSDLAHYSGKLVLGGPPECPTRPFCEAGLSRVYGIHFTSFRALDAGGPLTLEALKSGAIQIGLVFSSDPSVQTFHLTVLTDDKHLQTVDNVVPVVNVTVARPALTAALNRVSAVLTTSDLQALNARVQVEHDDPAAVASGYLKAKGLI